MVAIIRRTAFALLVVITLATCGAIGYALLLLSATVIGA